MDLLNSSFRSLRAHARFSLLVILLLALGIGANTAIFSVVHAVLLKPLPYPEPGDLVMARKPPRDGSTNLPGGGDMMPDNEFLAWTEAAPKSFRALAAYRSNPATLQRGDGAVRVPTAAVTGEFFPLLGVTAWRGRLFDPADLKPGAPLTTVLSYTAWQSRFHGEETVLGQVVKIDDAAHTVIGVLPPAFEFTDPVQFWRPLPIAPGVPGQLRIQMVRVFGRLLPGTALETATRELDELSGRFWNNLLAGLFTGGPDSSERRVVQRAAPGDQPAPGGEQRIISGPAPETGGAARTVAVPEAPLSLPPGARIQLPPGMDQNDPRIKKLIAEALAAQQAGGSGRRIVRVAPEGAAVERRVESGPTPAALEPRAVGGPEGAAVERRVVAGPGPEAGGQRIVAGPGGPAGGPGAGPRQRSGWCVKRLTVWSVRLARGDESQASWRRKGQPKKRSSNRPQITQIERIQTDREFSEGGVPSPAG